MAQASRLCCITAVQEHIHQPQARRLCHDYERPSVQIRDRIKELRRVKASQLRPHPQNWRTHPKTQQDALRGVLAEVGYVDALLARELPDGTLELIDGHLRAETTPDVEVPVLIVDLDDAEAAKLLALHDPLAGLAETDNDVLGELLQQIETDNETVQTLLDEMLTKPDLLFGGETGEGMGFRSGMGALKDRISHWRNREEFFDCPADVSRVLATKTRFVVLFSGGKDSLASLLWVRCNFPEIDCCAVFSDTGVEFPGMGAYVAEMCELLDAEYVVVKPTTEWWSWLRKKGRWPSLLYRDCAQQMIHTPCAQWVRANCKAEQTAIFTGSRAEEAVRGSQKTSTSSLGSLGKDAERYYHFAPCFNVKKAVLERVLRESALPLWVGYGKGFVRTACWCCPGQCGLQAAALQEHYPGLANEIKQWEKSLGVLRPEDHGIGTSFNELVARGHRQRGRSGQSEAKQQSL